MHPVSANPVSPQPDGQLILCPVVFESYKHMTQRLTDWLTAVDHSMNRSVRMFVTASPAEVPVSLAANPRLHFVGRLNHAELCSLWARSRAVYFPPGLEAFGFPLAEARVNGQPVIARDTPQGTRKLLALLSAGYTVGDPDSLRQATEVALTTKLAPDLGPFNPDSYFEWMLGSRRMNMPHTRPPGRRHPGGDPAPPRLGVLDFHPIQYHTPLYQRLSARGKIELTVLYLSDDGFAASSMPGFSVRSPGTSTCSPATSTTS